MASSDSSSASTTSVSVSSLIDPQNPSSPYYLHPNENPALILVSPVLTGSNYHSWARAMKMALMSKNKQKFIDRSILAPSTSDPLFSAWERCNTMIIGWLNRSMSPTIAQSVMWVDKAYEVWDDLKDRYSHGDIFRISDLQEEIYSIRQGDLTVSEYYTKLKIIWDELSNLRPVSACTCSTKCSCGAVDLARRYQQQDYVIRFLKGLSDRFSGVKSQIMLLDPLPTINKVFSLVIQQERELGYAVESTALAAKVPSKFVQYPSKNGNGKQCTHCGKSGHTVDTCYRKHGFPPGFKFRNPRPSANSVISSTGMLPEDNIKAIPESKGVLPTPSPTASFGFTPEQYQKILALVQSDSKSDSHSANLASTSGSHIISSIVLTKTTWILDTGATDHICCNLSLFSFYQEISPIHVKLPNGTSVMATHSGTIHFSTSFYLIDVLYIPDFQFNLISVLKLTRSIYCCTIFCASFCSIQALDSWKMIGSADVREDLYILNQQASPRLALAAHKYTRNTDASFFDLWHFRLGHLSQHTMSHVLKQYPTVTSSANIDHCDICHFAKQKKLPFPSSTSRSPAPFHLLHVDIWGPSSQVSVHGHKYFLTIVDDFSRYTWTFPMKLKSESRTILQNFVILHENQFSISVKIIRSDNGREFLMTDWFASKGIFHQTSCIETPEQNSVVERKHQHLLNVTRALLFQAKVPKSYWSYALLHATYLINLLPSPLLHNKTPHELFFNHTADLSNLKVFGSLCYASTSSKHRSKLDSRAHQCIFLGFKPGTKGFVLLNLHTREIFISRNVSFHESIFPFHTNIASSDYFSTPPISDTAVFSFPQPQPPLDYSDSSFPSHTFSPLTSVPSTISVQDISEPSSANSEYSPASDSPLPPSSNTSQQSPRRSIRPRRPPTYLQDYHCALLTSAPTPSSPSGTAHLLSKVLSYHRFSSSHRHFSLSISATVEPRTYKQAMKHDVWQQAMRTELNALEQNHTWILTELPPGKEPIGCKWVFKTKYKADGSIERHKARLVAKGYTQTEGVDYLDTFSPVAKLTTVRLVIALAAAYDWHLHQLDVNNAFLHGDLHEEVYMVLPEGLSSSNPRIVCKLQNSLYGLKQASRQWFSKLSSALISFGYCQSKSDYSLFIRCCHNSLTVLLVYVDDIILAGNDLPEIQRIKSLLDDYFKIKDLGILKYFLGLEISRSQEGIILNQRKYALEILSDAGFLDCKPVKTPMDKHVKLSKASGTPLVDSSVYRTLVGRLLYLTTTRPDLSFAVQQLSQFVSAPTDIHLKAVHHTLRYLKSSPAKGLLFPSACNLKLKGYSDSDWAGCVDTRRSVSGLCFFLDHSPISWRAKKQSTVSKSSSEAEYRALASATTEAQWLLYLLQDLYVPHKHPALIYCDNQSALHIAANPTFHERTKHIEIDCHIVRDKLQDGVIHLLPLKSSEQVADIFTKPLDVDSFQFFCSKLGMVDLHSPA